MREESWRELEREEGERGERLERRRDGETERVRVTTESETGDRLEDLSMKGL